MYSGEQAALAFVYCDYKDSRSQTALSLISSLVRQLAEQHKAMPSEVRKAYADHTDGEKSLSVSECTELLFSLSVGFRRTFILVDALDECSDDTDEGQSDQQVLITALLRLQRVSDDQRHCSALITSRKNRRVERQLAKHTCIEIRATNQDIESYVGSRIFDVERFAFAKEVKSNPDLGQTIVGKLIENAQGM